MKKFRYTEHINVKENGGWSKLVTGVDKAQNNGYDFAGDFLNAYDKEFGFEQIILHVYPGQSKGQKLAKLVIFKEGGPHTVLEDKDWRSDFKEIRDTAYDLFHNTTKKKNEKMLRLQNQLNAIVKEIGEEALYDRLLKMVSDEKLQAEIERRKGLDEK